MSRSASAILTPRRAHCVLMRLWSASETSIVKRRVSSSAGGGAGGGGGGLGGGGSPLSEPV